MRAAEWEFRYRFWVILGLFLLAAACYRFDRVNAGVWLVATVRHARGVAGMPSRGPVQGFFVVATLLCAAGAWLRTWAAAYLHTEVVHDEALHADRLVADGPYRHLRNPLYLGLLIAAVGIAATMSRTGAVLLLVVLLLFVLRLIGREEAALTASGGESYVRYRDAVPALVPALRPRLPASDTAPQWAQAFLGEAFFWCMTLGLAVFAATVDARLYLGVVAGSLLVRGVLANLWWRRRGEISVP
jgi:protein-S-isoprenylcysteine O-methyltransferase Ste14